MMTGRRHLRAHTRVQTRSSPWTVSLALVAVALFAACGGGDEEPEASSEELLGPSTAAASPPLPGGEPPPEPMILSGLTLNIGILRPLRAQSLTTPSKSPAVLHQDVCAAIMGSRRAIPGTSGPPSLEERWLLGLVYDRILPQPENLLLYPAGAGGPKPMGPLDILERTVASGTQSNLILEERIIGQDGVRGTSQLEALVRAAPPRWDHCPNYQDYVRRSAYCFGDFIDTSNISSKVLKSELKTTEQGLLWSTRLRATGLFERIDGEPCLRCREVFRLLFGRLPYFAQDRSTGVSSASGPFEFFCADPSAGTPSGPACSLRRMYLKRNDCHPLAQDIGVENIRVAAYNDVTNALGENSEAHLVISTASPSPETRELRKHWSMAVLPAGEQIWALFNSERYCGRAAFRRRFSELVLRPAMASAHDAIYDGSELLDASAFVNQAWIPPGGPLGDRGLGECEKKSFDHADAAAGDVPSEMHIDVVGLDLDEPLMKHLRAELETRAKESMGISLSFRETRQLVSGGTDVFIFAAPLSSDPIDPAPGLDSALGVADQIDLCPNDSDFINRIEELLRQYEDSILLTGSLVPETTSKACEVENLLRQSGILLPAFVRPVYLYYKADLLSGPPQANTSRGLVNLQDWMSLTR